MPAYDVREEVVNVALAEHLERRGLVSIPETIRRSVSKPGDRQLPDITIFDLLGIRMVIEGRFDSGKAARDSLLKDAKERVEQGISPVCLAALYPVELRSVESMPKLRSRIGHAILKMRVISEGGDGEWVEGTVDDIAEALKHSYELIISDDVVATAVEELESSIDFASDLFIHSEGLKAGFRHVLGIPEETDKADDDEGD
jgi:hypothetical protein